MRVYHDFEFLENGETIESISVGMMAEEGREYYAVFAEIADPATWHRIMRHEFLREQVVPHLPLRPVDHDAWRRRTGIAVLDGVSEELDVDHPDVKPRHRIRQEVEDFLLRPRDGDLSLWAWFGAYDHVALAQLWGPMMKLPHGVPMRTGDLAQEADRLIDLGAEWNRPRHTGRKHHALDDARHDRDIHLSLMELEQRTYERMIDARVRAAGASSS